MDTKIEIKEEDPLSDDVAPQNQIQFFTKNVTVKKHSDAVLLDDGSTMTIKTEIKPDTPFLGFRSQNGRGYFTQHHLKQIKSETVTCSNHCEIDTKIAISSQKEGKFLSEDPVIEIKKYNHDHEMDDKLEIKDESWWLETETPFAFVGVRDGNLTPVKSQRLCTEAIYGGTDKSPLPTDVVLERERSFYDGKDYPECESQVSYITEIPTVEEHVDQEQSAKCSNGEKLNSRIYNRGFNSNIPQNNFTEVSHLNSHEFIHREERPHICKVCDKSFIQLSHLKCHSLIHEGIKPFKCEICDKSFTQLAHLKSHNVMHEGIKPFKCEICDKSFTRLSHLKSHSLLHEGIKPFKCEICDKGFTRLSHLKSHNLLHQGTKPYKCEICDKSFSRLQNLKNHNLIHEGIKPYKCEICDKSFRMMSHLKTHKLLHEGLKPYKCKICDKSFTQFSHLKSHNTKHDGFEPYKCEICEKTFTHLSHLISHNNYFIHDNIKT